MFKTNFRKTKNVLTKRQWGKNHFLIQFSYCIKKSAEGISIFFTRKRLKVVCASEGGRKAQAFCQMHN